MQKLDTSYDNNNIKAIDLEVSRGGSITIDIPSERIVDIKLISVSHDKGVHILVDNNLIPLRGKDCESVGYQIAERHPGGMNINVKGGFINSTQTFYTDPVGDWIVLTLRVTYKEVPIEVEQE